MKADDARAAAAALAALSIALSVGAAYALAAGGLQRSPWDLDRAYKLSTVLKVQLGFGGPVVICGAISAASCVRDALRREIGRLSRLACAATTALAAAYVIAAATAFTSG